MEVIAKSKYIRTSLRKLNLIAEVIRGSKASDAVDVLRNISKRPAKALLLALKQAIGNAVNNFNLDRQSLVIKRIEVGKGASYKRGKAVSRGQWHPILKRTCHLTIVLEGQKVAKNKKGNSNGSQS